MLESRVPEILILPRKEYRTRIVKWAGACVTQAGRLRQTSTALYAPCARAQPQNVQALL